MNCPKDVMVLDDFLPDFQRTRTHAITSEFYDWLAPDGEVYRRVSLTRVPGLAQALVEAVGNIEIHGAGYRLNYAGEVPNQSIHSDVGWGTHACVVYLNEGPGGTAFWRHKATQTTEISQGQSDLLEHIQGDFENADAWEVWGHASIKANRAVIYRGNMFHSRFPFEGFGSTPEDGRLIIVAFFSFH